MYIIIYMNMYVYAHVIYTTQVKYSTVKLLLRMYTGYIKLHLILVF